MVGGGQNAFIGAVHRMAANLDGQIELVAGAFSSDAKNSKATGEQLFLNPRRVYASYAEMAECEAALPADERGKLMREHVAVGQKYPKIRINTSYSYGVDDQEFIVAFEGDDPAQFLDLVHDLRYTEASSYTQRDTPMFTCVLRTPAALADEFRAAIVTHST